MCLAILFQVVSDKVLVKQLQKEVARLEAELKVPDLATEAATSEALLQAKDLQIQKVCTLLRLYHPGAISIKLSLIFKCTNENYLA